MLVFEGKKALDELKAALDSEQISKLLCVCGSSCQKLPIMKEINESGLELIIFDDFKPNPDIASAVAGIEAYRANACEGILAIGGGSAMDVAKCIKLYVNADLSKPLVEQEKKDTGVKLIAIPTTAGTGSEATRFSVVYYEGNKQSVTHDSLVPDYVVLAPLVLENLPDYQRRVTGFDALAHAIESFWSVNSTQESREISKTAIKMILENFEGYVANDSKHNANMLKAANLAGQAINITQTTAGHAMSYKLTSVYGLAHGHAVAVSLIPLWKYMKAELSNNHEESVVDERGLEYMKNIFEELETLITAGQFESLVRKNGLDAPKILANMESEVAALAEAVNPTRLKNNPILLENSDLCRLYRSIFEWK